VDTDLDGAGDAEASGEEAGGDDTASEGSVGVARLLSLRNAVFFTGFFGMSGTLLSLLGTAPAPTLGASIAAGLLAAAAIQTALDYLRRTQSGALPEPSALAGARARVLVGPTRESLGKVEVEAAEGTQQLVARVHPESGVDHFEPGDAVVIVRVDGGQALVAEKTFFA
jgi:membrane protein implicated in regulation of membrane protease activity